MAIVILKVMAIVMVMGMLIVALAVWQRTSSDWYSFFVNPLQLQFLRLRLLSLLCCAVLCCAVLCCAVLCCAVLCCAVLCYRLYALRFLKGGGEHRPGLLTPQQRDPHLLSAGGMKRDLNVQGWVRTSTKTSLSCRVVPCLTLLMLCCSLLCCAVLYCTLLYSTVLNCTVL